MKNKLKNLLKKIGKGLLVILIIAIGYCILSLFIPRPTFGEDCTESLLTKIEMKTATDGAVTLEKTDKPIEVYEYYYEQLDEEQQKVYRKIYDGLTHHKKRIIIRAFGSYDLRGIVNMLEMVLYDHPEIYYLNDCKTYCVGFFNFAIFPRYNFNEKEVKTESEKIETWLDSMISEFNNAGNTEDTTLGFISDYIAENTVYDCDDESKAYERISQSLYSVVTGKSVCAGYSSMFKFICDKIEVPSLTLSGRFKLDKSIGHAWNKVYINNQWFEHDVLNGCNEIVNNVYKSHRKEKTGITTPNAVPANYRYYRFNGNGIESREDFERSLKYDFRDCVDIGESSIQTVTFMCESREIYDEIMNNWWEIETADYYSEVDGKRIEHDIMLEGLDFGLINVAIYTDFGEGRTS